MERRQRENRRTRILAAARTEFAAHGYHGTSIDRIIARAEVARATFYQHFKSKREVFETALEELMVLVYRSLPPIVPTEAVGPQALRNIERILHALLDDVDLARLILMEGYGPDEEAREKIARFHARLVDYAERTLEVGQQLGMIREGDVRAMAAVMVGAVKEVLYQHLSGLRDRSEIERLPRELLLTLMTGVGTEAVQREAAAVQSNRRAS